MTLTFLCLRECHLQADSLRCVGTSVVRKRPPPLGLQQGPRHCPTGGGGSYERGIPVAAHLFGRDSTGAARRTERKHGLSTEQVPVSAYVGSSKNLKDLEGKADLRTLLEVAVPAFNQPSGLDHIDHFRFSIWQIRLYQTRNGFNCKAGFGATRQAPKRTRAPMQPCDCIRAIFRRTPEIVL